MNTSLIVKINQKCNFCCDFCSSNKIAENNQDLPIETLEKVIIDKNVKDLIINGGDPLMVSPQYYWDLIEFIKSNNLDTTISFTTNLKGFWEDPEKWTPLFTQKECPVMVCTSFQYGTQRKIKKNTPFTEEMFQEVFELFFNKVGYKVPFIAVINDENEQYAIKHVELAKKLGTVCRVNGMVMSGRASSMYPFYKIYNMWLDIIEQGLGEYEENCKLIKRAWKNEATQCPFLSTCGKTIYCLSPSGLLSTCGSLSDDLLSLDTSEEDMKKYITCETPQVPFNYSTLKNDCYLCKFYNTCNTCHKRIFDIKRSGGVETHCQEMKKLMTKAERILG